MKEMREELNLDSVWSNRAAITARRCIGALPTVEHRERPKGHDD